MYPCNFGCSCSHILIHIAHVVRILYKFFMYATRALSPEWRHVIWMTYKVLCFRKVDRLKCSAAPVIRVMEHLQSKVGRGCLFLLFVHASFTLHSAARDRNLMILLWIDGVLPFSQRNWLLSSGNSSIGAETFGWIGGIGWISATSLHFGGIMCSLSLPTLSCKRLMICIF
jgi:hypothetical protein